MPMEKGKNYQILPCPECQTRVVSHAPPRDILKLAVLPAMVLEMFLCKVCRREIKVAWEVTPAKGQQQVSGRDLAIARLLPADHSLLHHSTDAEPS